MNVQNEMPAWRKFLKNYNEFLSIPIALVLFFIFPGLYRRFDATAGAFDAGYLHILVFSVIVINLASGIAWLMLRMSFPFFYSYFDDQMEEDVINNGDHLRKAAFPMIIYMIYFLALVLVIMAMV